MSRAILLVALLVVSACSGRESQPRNLDDACAMMRDRPHWHEDLAETRLKWGAPEHIILSMIYHESAFEADARTPRKYILGVIPNGRISSAYGYSQALDGTWEEYQRATGNGWGRRDNFDDAVDFMGWYMNNTTRMTGVSKYDAYNQYLAYHEGQTGFLRGNHRRKPGIRNYARRVERRANMYRSQLSRCPL